MRLGRLLRLFAEKLDDRIQFLVGYLLARVSAEGIFQIRLGLAGMLFPTPGLA